MTSKADQEIAAQVPLTPGDTRSRPSIDPSLEEAPALATTSGNPSVETAHDVQSTSTPGSAKLQGLSHADSQIAS